MRKVLVMIAGMMLVISGCSDRDDGSETTFDSVMESGKEMAQGAAEKAGEAYDSSKEAAAGAYDVTKEAAGDAYDATKGHIHDTAQAVADATADTEEGAAVEAAQATGQVVDVTDDAVKDAGSSLGQ